MSCKSAIYVTNTALGTDIADNGIYAPTAIVRRYGKAIQLVGNGIQLNEGGYYEVNATATVTATAVGDITATLYQDGMPVAGATATATAAVGDVVTLPIPTALVRVRCCGDSVLSVRISGQATTAYNLGWSVEKE